MMTMVMIVIRGDSRVDDCDEKGQALQLVHLLSSFLMVVSDKSLLLAEGVYGHHLWL